MLRMYVVDVQGFQPARIRQEIIWNRTANLRGGEGHNIPLDLVNEFLNRDFKGNKLLHKNIITLFVTVTICIVAFICRKSILRHPIQSIMYFFLLELNFSVSVFLWFSLTSLSLETTTQYLVCLKAHENEWNKYTFYCMGCRKI